MSLKKIKLFFKDYKFTNEEIRLDNCTVIKDLEKYVTTQFNLLDAQSGKKWAMPYYERLERVYNKIKTEQ